MIMSLGETWCNSCQFKLKRRWLSGGLLSHLIGGRPPRGGQAAPDAHRRRGGLLTGAGCILAGTWKPKWQSWSSAVRFGACKPALKGREYVATRRYAPGTLRDHLAHRRRRHGQG
ncbi:MAG: hypothetical protein AAB225_09990, partial [Acidobacteriota bacterium]